MIAGSPRRHAENINKEERRKSQIRASERASSSRCLSEIKFLFYAGATTASESASVEKSGTAASTCSDKGNRNDPARE